jgi:uncharacterized protein YneF (UPF0154 family)
MSKIILVAIVAIVITFILTRKRQIKDANNNPDANQEKIEELKQKS